MLSNFNILRAQVITEIKRNTSEMQLGYFWWLLEPILLAVIYYFLIHMIFGRGGDDYHIFILSGLVVWQGFAKSLQEGTTSITKSIPLILQSKFPLYYLVLSPVLVNAFYLCVGLIIVMVLAGYVPTIGFVQFILVLIVQMIFTFGLSLILSILNVYIRDTSRLLRFILRAWWFLSPVLYGLERITETGRFPQWAKDVYLLNPFATFIPLIREVFMYSRHGSYERLLYPFFLSVIMLLIGILVFKRHSKRIVKYL